MTYAAGMRPGDELAGKVALVTGGARNIGRAIAQSLAAGGATVMVNANTSREAGAETVAMIEKAGGKAALHIADVTDPRAVAQLVAETVKKFGRIDLLINNAAILEEGDADILRIPLKLVERTLINNTVGALRVAQEIGRAHV